MMFSLGTDMAQAKGAIRGPVAVSCRGVGFSR